MQNVDVFEEVTLDNWPAIKVRQEGLLADEEIEATKKDLEVNDFMALLCSVPVEGAGTLLDRKRSQGPLGISPKVAIISLIKWMEQHGYTKKNWDFYDVDMLYPTDEELREYFNKLQPQVVGLSAVVSTSYSQIKRISKIIREECPDCWIVMGGNLAASSESVLIKTEVDVTIVGDGEIAWVNFLNYVRKHGRGKNGKVFNFDELKLISGLCFLDENESLHFVGYGPSIEAKNMILPDFEVMQEGLKPDPSKMDNHFRTGISTGWFNLDPRAFEDHHIDKTITGLFSTKGCVAKCTFCQRSTKGYRVQPYEHLDAHLKFLKEKYNVGFIEVMDENFGSNRKHAYEFARILWENDMLWLANGVRCRSVTEEDIIFYKAHGCSALKFGVESGSQKILDIMEKIFTVDDVHTAIDWCNKHGVFSPLAVMVGMPGEDLHTAQQTGEMIGRVAAGVGVHPKLMTYDIFYALPLPGTPLYEYGECVGIIDKSPTGAGDYLERVSNAATYKRYYINLSGAPVSEVIFWDVLVALEASRTYREYIKKEGPLNLEVQQKYIEIGETRSGNPRFALKYTALDFTIITWFIDNYIVGNIIVDSLPRFIIYPIVRWLNYFEFLIQGLFKKNVENNLFSISTKGVPRLDNRKVANNKSNKARSLRGIVKTFDDNSKETNESFASISRTLLKKGL
jgi:anaerobic magnesium-protoporphyrin IX monomethyl ester cyclase